MQLLLSGQSLVDESVALLREQAARAQGPLVGCFSGGKDSVVVKRLCRMAGVSVDWYYSVTTIDPPELVRFIRRQHADVTWCRSGRGNFFRYAAEVRGFPTRRQRWCCSVYKESYQPPHGATMVMGIRSQESAARARRWSTVTKHFRHGATVVNPAYDWDDSDVWSFIRGEGVPYCQLYDEGFHRLGCIGCPMSRRTGKLKEFARWPKYEEKWQRVFRRVWERKAHTRQRDGREWFGSARFESWQQMWRWWLHDTPMPRSVGGGQLEMR